MSPLLLIGWIFSKAKQESVGENSVTVSASPDFELGPAPFCSFLRNLLVLSKAVPVPQPKQSLLMLFLVL